MTDLSTATETGASMPGEPSRPHVLARLLALCLTSIAMVAGGNAMLALPQIREGLWAFDDGAGGEFWRQAAFVLAFLFWTTTTWYVARLTLGRRFPHDSVGSSSAMVNRVAQWLPRILALAACLPIALFTLGTGKHPRLAATLIAVSTLFLVFTWGRRKLFKVGTPPEAPGSYYRYFDRLRPSSRITLTLGFLIPHVVLAIILWEPITAPRAIGAPALMLLAMGAWALVGGMLLSYLPRSAGWVTLGWLPPVLLVAFSFSNDNHPIDWLAGPRQDNAAPPTPQGKRPELLAHYERWIRERPPNEPVFLIASEGGASRASYWTGMLLGRLEDEARASNRRFGSNIFMLSGVSGGSVGVAAYASALRAWPESPTHGHVQQAHSNCFRLSMDRFLGADVLAPVGALMLFPDLMLRLLPPLPGAQHFDRSRGLEQAWASDWQDLMRAPPQGCARPSKGADQLWASSLVSGLPAQAHQPSIVLNSVRLEDSRRVVQSNIQLDLRDAEDLLGPGFEARAQAISLAGAAHNSARFPLVSPPGNVHTACGNLWGHLGDGGYHEVTGASTLADVLQELIELGCLRRDPPRAHDQQPTRLFAKSQCGHGPPPAHARDATSSLPAKAGPPDVRVVVVLLDNTPGDFSDITWQRATDGTPHSWSPEKRPEALRTRVALQPIEWLGPIFGLITHSSQAARSAIDRLNALAGTDPFSVIPLRFPRYQGLREPSMNWQLDRDSRREMMCAAEPVLGMDPGASRCHGACSSVLPRRAGHPANQADEALLNGLRRLRAWINHRDGQPAMQEASK